VGKLSFTKAAGIAGILTGLLFFASALVSPVTDLPSTDSPAREAADFISAHRGETLAAIWMNSLGGALFAVLLTGLRERLGDAWSRAGLASGLLATAIFVTGFAALVTAAYRVDDVSPESVQLFSDFAWATFAISSISVTVSLACFAASILDTGKLPSWLAWTGIAVAVLHVVAATAYAGSSGALSLEGEWAIYVPVAIYAWAIAAGAALVRSD
jgi:hypothetical protein